MLSIQVFLFILISCQEQLNTDIIIIVGHWTGEMVKYTAQQPKTEQDLQLALKALETSLIILYHQFQIVFKIIGLLFLAYFAYRLGKLTVSEPIAKKVKKIQAEIKEIEEQKQKLPTRIKKISKNYMRLIIFFLLIGVGGFALVYTQNIKVTKLEYYIAPFFVIPVFLFIIKKIHISSLQSKSSKIIQKQKSTRQKIKQLNNQIGPKVQANIRGILCRDKLTSKQNAPTHICSKKDCQQLRQVLKNRYQAIRNLAESALQFQWCSTCKSRKPFDELIKFEAKPMPVRDGEVTQQEDAQMKSNYLLETLEQINKWIQDAGPCNCSKLYMEEILKSRKSSSRTLKQLNNKIEQLNKNKPASSNNPTVLKAESRMSQSTSAYVPSNTSSSNMLSSGRVVYSYKKDA